MGRTGSGTSPTTTSRRQHRSWIGITPVHMSGTQPRRFMVRAARSVPAGHSSSLPACGKGRSRRCCVYWVSRQGAGGDRRHQLLHHASSTHGLSRLPGAGAADRQRHHREHLQTVGERAPETGRDDLGRGRCRGGCRRAGLAQKRTVGRSDAPSPTVATHLPAADSTACGGTGCCLTTHAQTRVGGHGISVCAVAQVPNESST